MTKYGPAVSVSGSVTEVIAVETAPGASPAVTRRVASNCAPASYTLFDDTYIATSNGAVAWPPAFRTVFVTATVAPAAAVRGDGVAAVTTRSEPTVSGV